MSAYLRLQHDSHALHAEMIFMEVELSSPSLNTVRL